MNLNFYSDVSWLLFLPFLLLPLLIPVALFLTLSHPPLTSTQLLQAHFPWPCVLGKEPWATFHAYPTKTGFLFNEVTSAEFFQKTNPILVLCKEKNGWMHECTSRMTDWGQRCLLCFWLRLKMNGKQNSRSSHRSVPVTRAGIQLTEQANPFRDKRAGKSLV